jgi:hypothetical protein
MRLQDGTAIQFAMIGQYKGFSLNLDSFDEIYVCSCYTGSNSWAGIISNQPTNKSIPIWLVRVLSVSAPRVRTLAEKCGTDSCLTVGVDCIGKSG